MASGDTRRGYARSRERDEAIRAQLTPLAPGERPLALRLSALLAATIALGNLAAVVADVEVDGKRPIAPALVLVVLMTAAAVGLWQRRYLAVLLWEAVLAIALIYAALSLMLAGNTVAVVVCVTVIAVAGPLFWFLIRIMARMQVPRERAE